MKTKTKTLKLNQFDEYLGEFLMTQVDTDTFEIKPHMDNLGVDIMNRDNYEWIAIRPLGSEYHWATSDSDGETKDLDSIREWMVNHA
jgi:hypothetical protein